ncbi:hypothetical protein [Halomarina pelagica]|uniref:hypothetical protein n=1 Tax=Halomarina pelagica TaxID=2961599 RepID=UPI0020C396C2|nr:hypothetical protein [Halomarina sp. BND7]
MHPKLLSIALGVAVLIGTVLVGFLFAGPYSPIFHIAGMLAAILVQRITERRLSAEIAT